MATVRLAGGISFGFGDAQADIDFDPRLDHMNFRELEAGTLFGRTRQPAPLDVRNEAGHDVGKIFFSMSDGSLRLARRATPAMLTLDRRAVQQDCLCYLMERVPFELMQSLGQALSAKP